jgi:hypothetical protein
VTTFIAKNTVWRNNFPTVRTGEFQYNSAPFTKLGSFAVLELAFGALHFGLPYDGNRKSSPWTDLFVLKRAQFTDLIHEFLLN